MAMDPKRLAEIRARCDAASPGPWTWKDWGAPISEHWTLQAPPHARDGGPSKAFPDLGCPILQIEERDTRRLRDHDFIAHAREDVPDLLAEVARLQQENADLRESNQGAAHELIRGNREVERLRALMNERPMAVVKQLEDTARERDSLRTALEISRAAHQDATQLAQAAALEEREACAAVAEQHVSGLARLGGGHYDDDRRILRERGAEIAAAIRAR